MAWFEEGKLYYSFKDKDGTRLSIIKITKLNKEKSAVENIYGYKHTHITNKALTRHYKKESASYYNFATINRKYRKKINERIKHIEHHLKFTIKEMKQELKQLKEINNE